MKAVAAAFNQEKALVGAFSVITNLRMDLFEALIFTDTDAGPEGHKHWLPGGVIPTADSIIAIITQFSKLFFLYLLLPAYLHYYNDSYYLNCLFLHL